MAKRGREDGHLSREDYEREDSRSSFGQPAISRDFAKATPNTLGSRRILSIKKNGKKEQFAKHLLGLNKSFVDWLEEQVRLDASADLSDGFQDYIDHVGGLEDRFMRTYGEVLTFGSGDCGQLAHGTEDEDLMVKYPRVVYSLRDKKVVGIACGGIHNAVYTSTGHVYTWGCADDGSLGRLGDENVPTLVDAISNETIIRVACGDGQTLAVSVTGQVWGWGCYKDKEGKQWFDPSPQAAQAVKDIKKKQDTPILLGGLQNIVEVACGASFNIALDSQGTVYSWGLGESGELGREAPPMKTGSGEDLKYDMENILRHHLTPGHMYRKTSTGKEVCRNVKTIGCGAYHTFVATIGDQVFACGLNNYGQLGLPNTTRTVLTFLEEVDALSGQGIMSLAGGVHHSLVLSSTGVMYSFGRGDSGQLGYSEGEVTAVGGSCSVPKPLSVSSFKGSTGNNSNIKVVQVACGGNHNLALTDGGDVYTWGYGDMLALGHGDERDETVPRRVNFSKAKIKNITVTQVAGGGQHSAIIGRVVTM